ncbi:MAG: response regulator transcription factor, partial [Phycisphaerae bacterium]
TQLSRNIRKEGIGTPIIVLSVPNQTDERVAVLDAGADDFIEKPIEFRELVAHMNAMVRRCQADNAHILEYADLELDTANRNVRRGDRAIVLTPREFALLEYLVRNRERVVDRVVVGEHVWGEDYARRESNVVDVYVSRLRRKIDRPADAPLIHTAPGIGYILTRRPPTRH